MAALILTFLFRQYPPADVLKAASYVKFIPFFSFALFYFVFLLIVDSWSTTYVISRFCLPVAWKEILFARAATYLIMVINYPASQAAFAYYLKRRYRLPVTEALSAFLFIMVVDFLWVISLAVLGSLCESTMIRGIDLSGYVQFVGLVATAGFAAWLLFWRRLDQKILGRPIAWLEPIRTRPLFHLFEKARPLDYLRLAFLRTPIHLTIIISMYIVVMTFGTYIPFRDILGRIPIVFLVGTLPITPGGLGTVNAAMVELLAPKMQGSIFASGAITAAELMFTITLLWMFTNYFFKLLLGFVLLKKASKKLFSPVSDKS